MLRIGLTGGIGSGKSTVARIFEVLGIPVYRSDLATRQLMENDAALREAILAAFGPEAYMDGKLNRAFIAGIVFNDPDRLEQLNQLTHPATIRDAESWMARQQAPYVVKEAALIFESGSARGLDKVIGVYAPESVRLQRVMERDGLTREAVRLRMERQLDEKLKMKLCDHVIRNDGSCLVIPQVLDLHHTFLEKGSDLSVQTG